MSLLLTFYGDDFTGSTDSMEALAKAGLRTLLFLEPPQPEELARYAGAQAVGVAGVSRSLTPAEMDRTLPGIFAGLRRLAAPLFHIKVCSTFDSSPQIGSIGRTIEIGQQVFPENRYVPILVGAPSLGRYVVFGNLFARVSLDAPFAVYRLDRHPTMSRHPVTPMREADLMAHLQEQTEQPMALLNVLQLEGQEEAVDQNLAALLAQRHPNILLFDTLTDAHLQTVGRLLWQQAQAAPPLFCVGSSGVEYALTAHWRARGLLPESPRFRADPTNQLLVVSGSASAVTAQQIEWALERGFGEIALAPEKLLHSEPDTDLARAVVESGLEILRTGRSLIIHTCRGPDDPRLIAEFARQEEAGARLGRRLGWLLRALLLASGVRRAVVCGGDTSGYVARELGLTALETVAPIAPGSPLCRASASGSPLDGLEILFKGGQVGGRDLFGRVLRGTAG